MSPSPMTHKTIKAASTATDRGEFTAISATYSVDRTQERIVPGAFAKTIKQWQSSGKNIPLHFDHSPSAEDIIGWVDPSSMKETTDGLYVKGQLDLEDSEVAKEAWRSMKNNAVALSFGFLSDTRKGDDGITELVDIDLFEISIVPGPANPDTRLLSLKNANGQVETEEQDTDEELEDLPVEDGSDEEPEEAKSAPQDPLRKRTDELALEIANGGMRVRKHIEPVTEPDPEPLNEAELRRRSNELALEIARGY